MGCNSHFILHFYVQIICFSGRPLALVYKFVISTVNKYDLDNEYFDVIMPVHLVLRMTLSFSLDDVPTWVIAFGAHIFGTILPLLFW